MPQFTTPSSRWKAVQSRNPLAASEFIYSVITTRIYCRPTCPSRIARRANVIFHDSAETAEADGFRACKRCRPDVSEDSEKDRQRKLVERACRLLREEGGDGNERERWSVKALAEEVGVTVSHFCRVFKRVVGMTVGEYRSSLVESRKESRRLKNGSALDLASGDMSGGGSEVGSTSPGPQNIPPDLEDFNFNCRFKVNSGFVNGPLDLGVDSDLYDFNAELSSELVSEPSTLVHYADEDGMQFFDFKSLAENT